MKAVGIAGTVSGAACSTMGMSEESDRFIFIICKTAGQGDGYYGLKQEIVLAVPAFLE